MVFGYFAFLKARDSKLAQRNSSISHLPSTLHTSVDATEKEIINAPASEIIRRVQETKTWTTQQVVTAFSKQALNAHRETNCLTEILISKAITHAVELDTELRRTNKAVGPLHGVPVSLKDSFNIHGIDSSIGYSRWVGRQAVKDSVIVTLLKKAGATLYVKTNVPQTLLSFESWNPVFGATSNPFNKAYTSGGSSGGESALLALNGSILGLGTDIAGSVRIPAHYMGICSLKPSNGRIPKTGNTSSNAGIESIPGVVGTMARTVDDLEFFTRTIVQFECWKYDQGVVPLPWREVKLSEKLRIGYFTYDGIIRCSPPCVRAVESTVAALRAAGHQVFEFQPPDVAYAYGLATSLIIADSGKTVTDPIGSDPRDPGVQAFLRLHRWPMWIKRVYAWVLQVVYKDHLTATLLLAQQRRSVHSLWALTAAREMYRQRFLETWNSTTLSRQGQSDPMDCIICPVNPLPAIPHGTLKYNYTGCIYTFLWNLLDYTVGVLPVTKVDSTKDLVQWSDKEGKEILNRMEQNVFKVYDPVEMEGLPVGIQVVGRRLEEEKVLAIMQVVKKALNESSAPELQMHR